MNKKNKLFKRWIIVTALCALIAFAIPFLSISFMAEDSGPIVIVLDPGHGGADTGAVNYYDGLYEADVNLAIALACRDELLKYDGVEVYMTHTGLDPSTTMSLGDRIDMVGQVDADILISLHCNDAENKSAHGSEVYVSHSSYKDSYNRDSTKLALEFLEEFKEIGMTIRGVKTRLSDGGRYYYHDNGSVELGDYYAVIGGTIKKYGVPGILVEHAFITGDFSHINTPEKTAAFGIADAQAIVDYFGLTLKGELPPSSTDMEAVLVTDQDIISASDVSNSLISLPTEVSIYDYDNLQDIRRAYERLSAAGKTLVDGDYVDALYRHILQLNYQLHPVRIDALEESELTVNRINETVSGLNLAQSGLAGTNVSALLSSLTVYIDTENADAILSDTSALRMVAVDSNGFELDIGAQLGTGCRVQLWRELELIDELTVVITCDLSGDGACDSRDHLLLEDHLSGIAPLDTPAMVAADINNDGTVDDKDLDLLLLRIVSGNE